jgi:hypothetical protein
MHMEASPNRCHLVCDFIIGMTIFLGRTHATKI